MTRRLVDVAQDCIINEDDCGTDKGINIGPVMEGADITLAISERILGRIMAEDVTSPDGELVCPANTYVDETLAMVIEKAGVMRLKARSALTCESRHGICVQCYGRDLARGNIVNRGEAVGVIAAQSDWRAGHAADDADIPHWRRCAGDE